MPPRVDIDGGSASAATSDDFYSFTAGEDTTLVVTTVNHVAKGADSRTINARHWSYESPEGAEGRRTGRIPTQIRTAGGKEDAGMSDEGDRDEGPGPGDSDDAPPGGDRQPVKKQRQMNETEKKRELTAAEEAEKRARGITTAITAGLTLRTVAGDGSCLWHAISGALREANVGKWGADRVRVATISHMRAHRAEYEDWWDRCSPSPNEEGMEDFGMYLDLVQVRGAWGSALEAKAAAMKYDVTIVIVGGIVPVILKQRPTGPHRAPL